MKARERKPENESEREGEREGESARVPAIWNNRNFPLRTAFGFQEDYANCDEPRAEEEKR